MNNIDNFDSRALRFTDAYGQRFMRVGTYKFNIVKAGTGEFAEKYRYTIHVIDCKKGHKMKQHGLQVHNKNGEFMLEESEITIELGDMIMWSCRQPSAPAFEVIGDQPFFSSANMENECGYAHCFTSPGDYQWVDANGSKLSGVVKVSEPNCKCQKDIMSWQKKLSKGALVMINGNKVEPPEIKIYTGQTVYFAMIKTKGITITEKDCADGFKKVHEDIEKHVCYGK